MVDYNLVNAIVEEVSKVIQGDPKAQLSLGILICVIFSPVLWLVLKEIIDYVRSKGNIFIESSKLKNKKDINLIRENLEKAEIGQKLLALQKASSLLLALGIYFMMSGVIGIFSENIYLRTISSILILVYIFFWNSVITFWEKCRKRCSRKSKM